MQGIIEFFQNFVGWLLALAKTFIMTLVSMFEDLICWVCDELLSVGVWLVSLIEVDSLGDDTLSDMVGTLPAEVLNALWLLGVPHAVGIILTAIAIRTFLQLIPFTRLGS